MEEYEQQPAERSKGRAEPVSASVNPPGSAEGGGCLQGGLLAILDIWILAAVLVAQSLIWVTEQGLALAHGAEDPRWLIVSGMGAAVFVPSGLLWLLMRTAPNRRFYAAYAFSGLFAALLAPARMAGLTAAAFTALLLMLGMLVFLVLTGLFRSRDAVTVRAGASGTAVALLVAGLLGVPWLLWGAFGSLADILLNLGVALLFGLSAARLLVMVFAPGRSAPPSRSPLLLEGKVAGFVLLVMASGVGTNGNQGLLAFVLPALGWALAALYRRAEVDSLQGSRLVDNRRALALLAGLAVFWPLALLDPDELAAAPGFGLFEVLGWTTQAVLVNVITALAAGVLLGALRKNIFRWKGIFAAAALAAWVLAVAAYLLLGQPGFYGDRLFVIFKQQADLSQAAQVEDYHQRRAMVYQLLVEQADQSQAALRQVLDRWNIPYRAYYLENALEVQGGPLLRLWLERRTEVDRVLNNPVLRPLAEPLQTETGFAPAPEDTPWNLSLIGADRVWSELGVTGAGIVVGQSDSGAQGDHPELADSYRGRDTGSDYNWYDPWNGSPRPVDIGGHGTHTLGTVLGNRVGVAPDAEWIGCVNLARNLGSPSHYLDCMQFLLAPFPQGGDPLHDGRPEMGAHVLNNSWGCPPLEGCDPNALQPAASALRAAGVFVVASAGNDGDAGCGSVADPIAFYEAVYAVGAVDSSRDLAPFSSTGPVTVDGSRRIKPDIAAPGVRVLSSYPGSTYNASSGTSMAGPHVAGVVALMWSANPDLIGDIDRTEQILNETAAPYTGPLPECVAPGTPNNATGYGIVDAFAAVSEAMGR